MSSSDKGFVHTGSGINDQGNHWCSRDHGTGTDTNGPGRGDAYHYSNRDGSWYYKNPDGSRYFNNGRGQGFYTPPPDKK
ncbi:hypothetical protein P170DRAFT_510245 [Aspergillus steynii IBT 23096]|uniref:Uncharacterized protein n=1 Tax=Aspergillus steynii IBT 23096 TaxID=1392250 RepID=A0A2I2GA81_9EURO|nr:uncharacterized protein P170DRAFT_510245 [Aspergillus steynii IBT 23096]PLB49779.1 hypothetical protein P170DRAFT_510245 [Aspergillus steynii IBT 23096]